MSHSPMKGLLLEFLDFLRYKVSEDKMTMDDMQSLSKTIAEGLDLKATAKELAGFTFANRYSRRAVVLIGPTSSGAEFLDTFTHEVRHLADAIAKSIGYRLDSEGPAYMTGDTVRELADIVCRLGCDKCRR